MERGGSGPKRTFEFLFFCHPYKMEKHSQNNAFIVRIITKLLELM